MLLFSHVEWSPSHLGQVGARSGVWHATSWKKESKSVSTKATWHLFICVISGVTCFVDLLHFKNAFAFSIDIFLAGAKLFKYWLSLMVVFVDLLRWGDKSENFNFYTTLLLVSTVNAVTFFFLLLGEHKESLNSSLFSILLCFWSGNVTFHWLSSPPF